LTIVFNIVKNNMKGKIMIMKALQKEYFK